MKRVLLISLPLFAATLLLTVGAMAQVTRGKTRLALTKQVMKGLNQPNCAALGKGLKENPSEEEAWEKLAINAALLNEASYILMDDGRCPDKAWADAAKTLRECSAVVLDRIEERDAEGAQSAFQALTKACAACHQAHRPKK